MNVSDPKSAGVMDSGRGCQPDARPRHPKRGDTLVVVSHQACASAVRCQVQGREPVRGPAHVGQTPGPARKRPLPDARRAIDGRSEG